MELIRISDRKLKIMLTPTDMCHFDLNVDNFGEDSAKMHRAFRLLLHEIRKRTDFEADDTHISVQYFPSREGGCEMFISNLQSEESERPLDAEPPSARQSTALRPVKKHGGSFRKECAYRFEKLCHLLTACRRLLEIGYICDSSAYRDERGIYYLLLSVLSPSPFSTPEELDFIVEYGSLENASLLRLYVREHATLLCTGAVEQLAKLL